MSQERPPLASSSSSSSSSSDSECTEGEIVDVNQWLEKTPPKVASTLRRIARSKSFALLNTKLKTMASPFKETETPQIEKEPEVEEEVDPKVEAEGGGSGDEANASVPNVPQQLVEPHVELDTPPTNDAVSATVEDAAGKKDHQSSPDPDEETEEEKKMESFIEEKIQELPQEDRPEVTLVFENNGRVPTHDDGKLHVIAPNLGHEGHQRDLFYGDPPYAKGTRVWYGWPHSDPGKPIRVAFITCEKPFFVVEIGEDCYTLDLATSLPDSDADRLYYEQCLYPASRLHFYHEKNRLSVTQRGRPRVPNPKNWEGLPNVKDLPRGTIVVRNGMCFKILSHIEHCSAVFAQLCNEDGTVIGGPADADILHYDTDFKAPTKDAKNLMLNSLKAAEIQKTKTAAVRGKILRAETQKRKRRKPYKRETFTSDTQSAMKSQASHQSTFLLPSDQVSKERELALFGGRAAPSSVSSHDTQNSDKQSDLASKAAEMLAKQMALQKIQENRSLSLENEALRKECEQLKTGFAQMMSSMESMRKEKDAKLNEEAELSRQEVLQKNFPLEAALLQHYKEQKETAEKEKSSLQRQLHDLHKALEMQRAYVVEMKAKMKTELDHIKEKTGQTSAVAPAVVKSVAKSEGLRSAVTDMFKGRSQMLKLEEMLKTATRQCLEAGIEVPAEMLEMVKESEENEPPAVFAERSVRFEKDTEEPTVPMEQETEHRQDDQPLEPKASESTEGMEEGGSSYPGVDDEAKRADEEMQAAEEEHKSSDKTRSPRTGISVVLGNDGFYYDNANNAYAEEDVMKINDSLNIVTHPTKPKIVSTVLLLAAAARKKKQIDSAIQSVVGSSTSARREETRRSLFDQDEDIETYDIERFRTATPENEHQCMLFPSPIDVGRELNMTNEDFVEQNRYNDRTEKFEKLEAMSEAKHQQKLEHVRRVAEAEMAALEGVRRMEIAEKASRLRSQTPPFLIENIPDDDVQQLRELDAKGEGAGDEEEGEEKRAEERRRRKEEKQRLEAEEEARRAREYEEELRRKQQEEHNEKEKRRKEKLERRRMAEYELSGDRSVQQLQREQEFQQRERKRKAELDHDAELAAMKAKYRRLLAEKSSPTASEASIGSSKGSQKRPADDGSSDDDLRKKARKEDKPLNKEVGRLLKAKRAELQSLKQKTQASASAPRSTAESSGTNPRFRGNRIPESGYVQPTITPPFEVARKPGRVEDKATFLYPNEAGWRWNWNEFTTITLKVVSRKSLEANQVNVNEYQSMQLAAGFVTANLARIENFHNKESAYNELRQAIEAVQAMAEGNMRQVRATVQNRDLRDIVVQAALMTNVNNGADYRIVALKQLQHIRNSVTNKFHYDQKRLSKASGATGGGAVGGSGGTGRANASRESSESGD